ncbi:hypothetical protein MANES_12G150450v8 [Manihot esculenta]|uniref:Uncharacterized protein n=1 Tax=Manihot esculenta TaxID=3983 RepID=A0ACB7GW89_MANES|nr:hypothetical protein MANES_12G150450v8 [Manihot esculenta]
MSKMNPQIFCQLGAATNSAHLVSKYKSIISILTSYLQVSIRQDVHLVGACT